MTPVTKSIAACIVATALFAGAAFADAPVVTAFGTIAEPVYPSHVCAVLKAGIRSRNGSIDTYDDAGQAAPDTQKLQAAIDACHDGAVRLITGDEDEDGFLTAPIRLGSGVILWVDKGVTLFASRDPKDYDTGAGDCGTANTSTHKSCRSLIIMTQTTGAGVIGDGAVDGRGGSLLLSGPNAGKASWWDLAWLTKNGLTQHNFRLIEADDSHDVTLYRITLLNSPNFHFVSNNVSGLTAWGIRILSPSLEYSRPDYVCPPGTTPAEQAPATCFTPDTIKNTDGFDPGESQDVLLAYSYISDGDDMVAIKAHGQPEMRNMHLAHNHFYYGHGLSIGSETDAGAQDIVAEDTVIDGMDSPNGNGLRIKSDSSRGGAVTHIVYDGICLRNVRFPLVFDTAYSDKTGTLYPDFRDIEVTDFRDTGSTVYGSGTVVIHGYDGGPVLPIDLRFSDVAFDDGSPKLSGAHGHTDLPPATANVQLMDVAPALAAAFVGDPAHRFAVIVEAGTAAAAPRDCSHAFVDLKTVVPASPF